MATRRDIDDTRGRDDRGRDSRDRDDRGRDDRGSRDRDDRGSRERDDRGRDRDDRSSSRDRDDRGRDDRGRDDRSSRDRDGGREERSSRGSGSRYEYQQRDAASTRRRQEMGANDFDKILKPGVKQWKPNDGDNRIRLMPPTWDGADHYGLDIFVHYGVGADRGSYLDLAKMQSKPDPISEERDRFKRDMDPEDKRDQAHLKELDSKRRVLVYLIDRDNEKEGVQAWAMPWTVDRDIVAVSVDKSSGEVLPIDHPEKGYDVMFEKKGSKDRTEYVGIQVARRDSPLGKDEWMDYAVENPLPDQLQFFEYDHIAKVFGGAGAHRGADDRDAPKDRDRDDRGGKDRDDRSSRDREPPAREDGKAALSWASVHDMSRRELEDLIDDERLDINPREARDDDDLADWVCDTMKLERAAASSRRVVNDADDGRTRDRLHDRMRDRG